MGYINSVSEAIREVLDSRGLELTTDDLDAAAIAAIDALQGLLAPDFGDIQV